MTAGHLLARALRRFPRRAALGLNPAAAPIVVFVPLGILLGPSGSGLLSAGALAHLDLVVTIALATLGLFIGLAAAGEGRDAGRLFAASAVEAAITIAFVSGALLLLLRIWGVPIPLSYTVAAAALGVCASASSAPSGDPEGAGARQIAARVADLDDVLPIVAGAFVLAAVSPSGKAGWWSAAVTVGIGLLVGVIGWFLLERARDASERGVFVLGTLALLGGGPAYLDLSPLLAGMVAGWFWVVAPGGCDKLVSRELRKVQHPLIVLLLIVAGASLQPSIAAVWVLVPYVVFRLAGKLLGGWTASRLAHGTAPSDLGAYLVAPGVIGVAYALNLRQVAPEGAAGVVFAVTVGAVAAELIALVVFPPAHDTR
jgi:hypothetical protein